MGVRCESDASLVGVRLESHGSPVGVQWESVGSPLGVCWLFSKWSLLKYSPNELSKLRLVWSLQGSPL